MNHSTQAICAAASKPKIIAANHNGFFFTIRHMAPMAMATWNSV